MEEVQEVQEMHLGKNLRAEEVASVDNWTRGHQVQLLWGKDLPGFILKLARSQSQAGQTKSCKMRSSESG